LGMCLIPIKFVVMESLFAAKSPPFLSATDNRC